MVMQPGVAAVGVTAVVMQTRATTSMYGVFYAGELGVCIYLLGHGPALDIKIREKASYVSGLSIVNEVNLVFKMGAAEDIRTLVASK